MEQKSAIMFPGVGSQHHDMCKTLYDNFKTFRETLAEASYVLGYSIENIIYGDDDAMLNETVYVQPILVASCVAAYRVLCEELEIYPSYSIGYSLGEYSALCTAGYIKFSDAVSLVSKRAKIISELEQSRNCTMAWAINLDADTIERLCDEVNRSSTYKVYLSAYNSDISTSVSGELEAIKLLENKVMEHDGFIMPIKINGPYHSPLMNEAVEMFREYLEKISVFDHSIKVLSNKSADIYSANRDEFIEELSLQLIKPLKWKQSINRLIEENVTKIIEIGPNEVLTYILSQNTDKIKGYLFHEKDDINLLIDNF